MKVQNKPCRNLKTISGKEICLESEKLIGGDWVGLGSRKGLKYRTEEKGALCRTLKLLELGFGSGGA